MFTQTTNPLNASTTSAVAGFRFCSGPTAPSALTGLRRSDYALFDGEAGAAWHYAVGARIGYNGLAPGPSAPGLNQTTSFVEKVALYAAEFSLVN